MIIKVGLDKMLHFCGRLISKIPRINESKNNIYAEVSTKEKLSNIEGTQKINTRRFSTLLHTQGAQLST